MFLPCLRCRLCTQVSTDQLKFLSIGSRTANILIVETQAKANIQLQGEQRAALPLLFDEDNVNEQTFATIGSILFTENDPLAEKWLQVFESFQDVEYTWAVRCATADAPAKQMVDSCGIYSRSLYMNRKIIMLTEPAYLQMLAYMPMGALPDEFLPGKMYKTAYGVIITVKSASEWMPSDPARVQQLLRRAKREVSL